MSARQKAIGFGALSLTAAGLAKLIGYVNLQYEAPFLVALIAATILLAAMAIGLAVRSRPLRIAVLSLGGVLCLVWTGGMLWAAFAFAPNGTVYSRTSSPDGRYQLLVVEGEGFAAIDPIYAVHVRVDRGPLSQQALVWQGLEEGPVPTTLRFTGPRAVEVITDNGCHYRSTFDALTLRPTPVHRPRTLSGCQR